MIRKIKKSLIYNFETLRSWNFAIKRAKSKNAQLECERRKHLELYDIKSLSDPLDSPNYFMIDENNLYGNGNKIFPNFKNLDVNNCAIEHGFIFGSLVQRFHVESWTDTVVTFSDYRKSFIKSKTQKEVVCVGPYIHYANSNNILTDIEKKNLKNNLGKVLLIFPSHSIMNLDVKYDKDNFIDFIKAKSLDFDSVLVCLYWADILKGEDKKFLDQGYKVVTAGHINDLYFLDRLKLFFELSDAVLSNSVGTHVGYSIFMNKPLILHKQKLNKHVLDLKSNDIQQRLEMDNQSMDTTMDEIYKLFDNDNYYDITRAQYEFIGELFGFKYITPDA
ncbi:hypothetical protein [Sphingobacterium hungaricum]